MSRSDVLSRMEESSCFNRLAPGVIPNVGCGRFCRVDYLSLTGKWLTTSKLILLMLLPVVTSWSFSVYYLVDNIQMRDETMVAQDVMTKTIKLSRIMYQIQKERDVTILFMNGIGPETKALVIQEYEKTDDAIADMLNWPKEFAENQISHFRTKIDFMIYINQHRNLLGSNLSKVYDEITFYTDVEDFMIDWIMSSIQVSGFSSIRRTLIVFDKIIHCMVDAGLERAYGAIFFSQGDFPESNMYNSYFRHIHRFNYDYKSATYYSDLGDPLIFENTDQRLTTMAINIYRQKIKFSNFTGEYNSVLDAQLYFDNMTMIVNYMYNLQGLVNQRVISQITIALTSYVTNVTVYSFIAAIVTMSCPVVLFLSEALVSQMRKSSKILTLAINEIEREKIKADIVLYQMLPKPVVESLKTFGVVKSDYFEYATIMFSSIVNFTRLSIEFTPIDLIECLHVLYTAFDVIIEKHDVYKVESINDIYMVVSGVPVPNGLRHASEIAYMALDVHQMIRHAVYPPTMRIPIQLLVGINTGPVSGGVVGTLNMRYCLFGDTVNIASRMRSHSKPNRIHISETTYRNLIKTGDFRLQSRGQIKIKGKGLMETYWLLGANFESKAGSRLPGELSDNSYDDNGDDPVPSTH